jgi:hypothetical protein
MNTTIAIILGFIATFLGGIAIGFVIGISKGLTLGLHFRSGRPLSPIPWILSFIGAGAFMLVAVGSAIYSGVFLAKSVETQATVREIAEHRNKEGDVSRRPIYIYTDTTGATYTGTSNMGDGSEYTVGDKLRVRYLASSPQESRIDSFSHHWFLPIFMGAISMFLVALGYGFRWWRAREQQWANKASLPAGMNPTTSTPTALP